jgi:hypothetical protein
MSGIAGDNSPERCCPVIDSGIFDDMSRKIDKHILRVAGKTYVSGDKRGLVASLPHCRGAAGGNLPLTTAIISDR